MNPPKSMRVGYPHEEPTQYSFNQPPPAPSPPLPPPQYTPNPVIMQPSAIPPPSVQVMHIHQNPVLGPQPALVACYNCHSNVLTRLQYEASTRTHMFALVLCIVGLVPCAVLPYCCTGCQNCNHYCPSCGTFLGTYIIAFLFAFYELA